MTTAGAFTFVLHSHIPYARQAGMWPHGEEWIHEAIGDTYVPLLSALYDLEEDGVPFRLTIGITPILAEQLADPTIVDHFVQYAAERSAWACDDVTRFEARGEDELAGLARYYHQHYARLLTSFRDRFSGDLIGAFRRLQDRGLIEIATSAATHGYLPLLSRDSSIHGQIETGVDSYRRHFGREPRSIWLPECAYRPAYEESSGGREIVRPGIESFLKSEHLGVFFSETHTVLGGSPVGKAAGDSIGPYGLVDRRFVTDTEHVSIDEPRTTFRPYWVGDAAGDVAVLARNNDTGQQVWSADHGYPGDFWYREFHKKDGESGLHYWRIGDASLDLALKPLYEPDKAAEQVEKHSLHFAELVDRLLTEYAAESGQSGAISAAYDTELFGHWWFEGVTWLKRVLTHLAENDRVELSTSSAIVREFSPDTVLQLPESSWGAGGGHATWHNEDTAWMWPLVHEAESRMERLEAFADNGADAYAAAAQAARELLLLQSSDWPFLVTTGQAKEYAKERFADHLERFNQLGDHIEHGTCASPEARRLVEELEERDNPFPEIKPEWFRERQGFAGEVAAT